MANYALIETRADGKQEVVQTCSSDPKKRFHADIAKLFVSVAASVKKGQIKSGTKWIDDPDEAAKAYVSRGPEGSLVPTDKELGKDWQCVSKANFFRVISRDARTKYRKALADGDVDVVNDLDTYWTTSAGGEVWLRDSSKNTEWKNAVADLKTAGIISDADITALNKEFFLDRTAFNE